jgi:hypothetical protein
MLSRPNLEESHIQEVSSLRESNVHDYCEAIVIAKLRTGSVGTERADKLPKWSEIIGD